MASEEAAAEAERFICFALDGEVEAWGADLICIRLGQGLEAWRESQINLNKLGKI